MNDEKFEKKKQTIGLGLVSGGLDSLIACLILQLQDIKIVGLNFTSPFCQYNKNSGQRECNLDIFKEKLGIEIKYLPFEDDFLKIIKNPKFGYGKYINPCIDCRIYILRKAKKLKKEISADFIFTGEVLNQRPKSQHMNALKIIEKEADLEDKLLRPLSALHLKPTIYEQQGLIDRTRLLGIKGRNRKKQMEIARKYGILNNYYACGGCLLTDEHFTNRMKDYLKFNDHLKMEDIYILKFGRHFRYNNTKIIVGRNESENNQLLTLKRPKDLIIEAKDVPGPITIVQGKINKLSLKYAAMLTLHYSDLNQLRGYIKYGTDYNNLINSISIKIENSLNLKKYIL
ncbi:MAG: tRNA 4-thiouridine(8) synthase ThiI [Candidatus Odinarchaeota archaeon]